MAEAVQPAVVPVERVEETLRELAHRAGQRVLVEEPEETRT